MSRPDTIQWNCKQYLGDNKVLAMDWDVRGMHFHLLNISTQEEPPGTIPADDAVMRRWLSLPPSASLCSHRGSERGSERDPATAGRVSGYDSGCDCGCNDCVWRRVKPQLLTVWLPVGERLGNSGMIKTFERKAIYASRPQNGTTEVRERYQKPLINEKHIDTESELEVAFERREKDRTISEQCLAMIYSAYPKKSGRAKAIKAIEHAIRKLADEAGLTNEASAEMIYQAVKKFAVSDAGRDGGLFSDYTCPYPASWINAGRYMDDPKTWEKVNGQQATKTQQRSFNSATAILKGFGIDGVPVSGGEDSELRNNPSGSRTLEGNVKKATNSGN